MWHKSDQVTSGSKWLFNWYLNHTFIYKINNLVFKKIHRFLLRFSLRITSARNYWKTEFISILGNEDDCNKGREREKNEINTIENNLFYLFLTWFFLFLLSLVSLFWIIIYINMSLLVYNVSTSSLNTSLFL